MSVELGSPASFLSSRANFTVGTQVATELAELPKWAVAPRAQSQRERTELRLQAIRLRAHKNSTTLSWHVYRTWF